MFKYRTPSPEEAKILNEIDKVFCLNAQNEKEAHLLWTWLYSTFTSSKINLNDLTRFRDVIIKSPDYVQLLGNSLFQLIESLENGETAKLKKVEADINKFQELSSF